MNAPTPAVALYREHVGRVTPREEINRALAELRKAAPRYRALTLPQRKSLVEACLAGVAEHAATWVAAACKAKGIAADSPTAGEEWGNGPLATARYLRLLTYTLERLNQAGRLSVPLTRWPIDDIDGRLCVPIFPTRGVYDSLLFGGFRGWVRMDSGVTRDNLDECLPTATHLLQQPAGVSLVLGAGNVSSIAATDAFDKLFHHGRVVLLKMNPVNEYLGEVFERAFAVLVRAGYLRIVYGGAEVGAYTLQHPQVDDVHITGNVLSHEAIVWGPAGPERDRRRAVNEPLLAKPVSSELGNVTPYVIVPGEYTSRQLRFQAENVAAMIVNNASFNCIAVKMIVTSRQWPQRQRFLDMVDAVLARTPRRTAYYPGAEERFRRFTNRDSAPAGDGALPWTLLRDVRPSDQPHLFQEESFVCVTAETALEPGDAESFLDQATDFCNEQLFGTLGAGLMVPNDFRRRHDSALRRAVARLRYGAVTVNHWPGLAYAIMSAPWGGYPGGTLHDPMSGIGWVHNTYLLRRVEKSVLMGPLTVLPKPMWFPTHRTADRVARRVTELYCRPAWWKLPGIVMSAMTG